MYGPIIAEASDSGIATGKTLQKPALKNTKQNRKIYIL